MAESGIFSENDHVELIEGEIFRMAPIGSRHAGCVNRLNGSLAGALQGRAVVSPQNPVRLDDFSEPQPDLALLRFREDYYSESLPTPREVLLVVEVADASLEYDRRRKIPLYARNGVPEVWLVDLIKSVVEVYREPSASGYRQVQRLRRGNRLAPETFPDLVLEIGAILG